MAGSDAPARRCCFEQQTKLWRAEWDSSAIQLALGAAKHLDAAKVTVAIFYGTKGDWTRGIPNMQAAVQNGFWEAKQALAFCYANAEGVPKDIERARQLATEAPDQGSLDCMAWLARLYSDGVHREPSEHLAQKYGQWAANNGRPEVLREIEARFARQRIVWGKSIYDPKLTPRA